jgi:hypothetical protein
MKKSIALFAGLFLMTIAVQNVNAQNTATDNAETSATIIAPISISKSVDLDFGKIVRSSTEGTVVVTPAGARSFGGGAVIFLNDVNFSAAEFEILGEADATYSITVNNATFNVEGPGDPMVINTIVTSPTTGALDNLGEQTIKVGATLNVNASQAAGIYTNNNSLEITVAYN